jgi:predicted nucleic acid-binding protein
LIFIDSGALIAWYRESDAHHRTAIAAWKKLERLDRKRFTSGLVVDEVVRLLARYGGIPAAVRVGRALLVSQTTILNPTADESLEALDLMERYADQPIGYADCVSFVLMKKNRIRRVFGFDRHFRAAGFELWPARN